MRMFRVCSLLLLACGIAAGSGCSKDSSEPQPGASQGNEAPPAAPATGTVPQTKLTDGQITEILTTVDTSEIEQAQVALKKTNNPDVRAYATHLVEQHTTSKQAGAQLTSQTLRPAGSPKAVELQTKGTQMLEKLEAADAASFDSIYLQGQIQQHEEVLSMIDHQLLPAVNEPALRDHLTNARGVVQQHLEQARKLQKQ